LIEAAQGQKFADPANFVCRSRRCLKTDNSSLYNEIAAWQFYFFVNEITFASCVAMYVSEIGDKKFEWLGPLAADIARKYSG
jgi:hypothetical protein